MVADRATGRRRCLLFVDERAPNRCELGAERVDPPVQVAPLGGDLLLLPLRHLVREPIKTKVQPPAQARELAFTLLEPSKLDEQSLEVGKVARRSHTLSLSAD
jgi:hypothetical protein